ncbi:hypothetical protein [Embleya sp. NPDC020630]|uniref:hypothetical protein n=1 Tax=Embleya sp. NPDC020630 TaxID=3363979 RepID=UPI0037B8EC55
MPSQFIRNPALFSELARSDGVRDVLKARADAGHARLLATAPSYSGPTWSPSRTRSGEYAAMSFSHSVMATTGWRARYGSDAPWTMQVELGTGKRKRTRRKVTKRVPVVDLTKRLGSPVDLTKGVSLTKGRRRGSGGGGGGRGGTRTITTYITTSRRTRPQGGYNLRTRVMYRSLLSLKVRVR